MLHEADVQQRSFESFRTASTKRTSRRTRDMAISFALGQREPGRWGGRGGLEFAPCTRALPTRGIGSRPHPRCRRASAVPISALSRACAQGAWSPSVLGVRRRTRWAEAVICGRLWQREAKQAWGNLIIFRMYVVRRVVLLAKNTLQSREQRTVTGIDPYSPSAWRHLQRHLHPLC